MKRALLYISAAAMLLGTASTIRAQAIDSVAVAFDTRYRWRSYDRGDGVVMRSNISAALAGFATSRSSGDMNNLRFDLNGWTPLAHRANRRGGDQYEASLSYGRCFKSCDEEEWNKRLTLNIAANEYLFPNLTADKSTTEIEALLRGYLNIQRIKTTQFGLNISPFLQVDHDVQKFRKTYARAGAGTYIGPIGALGISLDLAYAMSNWPGVATPSRTFAFHGFDAQLGVDHDASVFSRHLSTKVSWGLEAPTSAIGKTVGVITVRFKLSGPVLLF